MMPTLLPLPTAARAALLGLLAMLALTTGARTQPAPDQWPLLPENFESTGGGGWMITEYRPVVAGSVCRTDFVAVSPDRAQRFANSVEWAGVPLNGGVMCTEGRWRAKDGSTQGTTPLEIFIKDGVVRRAP